MLTILFNSVSTSENFYIAYHVTFSAASVWEQREWLSLVHVKVNRRK